MKTKKLLSVVAFVTVLACSGCASWWWLVGGAAVGAGAAVAGVAYAKGDLEAYVEHDPIDVAKATEKAFEKLSIAKTSSSSSALDAKITGRTANNDEVKVKAIADGKGAKLSIRIGIFGDEIMSRRIYDEIQRQLSLEAAETK